jgi:PadR family transcriptional regulator, regulatory protein PadR
VPPKPELLQGTLDLMVLKTLEMLGPLHGFGVARRIEQLAGNGLELNHGTVYPALVRLEQQGWITSTWGASENNRRARYYSLTKSGKKRLVAETENWLRASAIMAPFLDAQ